jgi:hypothetical protein
MCNLTLRPELIRPIAIDDDGYVCWVSEDGSTERITPELAINQENRLTRGVSEELKELYKNFETYTQTWKKYIQDRSKE